MIIYLLTNPIPPKSLLGKAVTYTLNQCPKLLTYLQDGRLENSNNLSERAIKPVVIGRKAWLFAHSVEGAEAAAIIYSLIETCKHHHIEAYDWLRYVLHAITSCQTLAEFEALLHSIAIKIIDDASNLMAEIKSITRFCN